MTVKETAIMPRHFFLLILLTLTGIARANSESHEAPAKKADEHGKAKGGQEKKGGEGGHGAAEAPAAPPVPSGPKREYNPGKVMPFPPFTAEVIGRQQTIDYKPQKGRAALIIFVASWCEPCQVLMPEFKQLARKYASDSTDVFFVFAHDTKQDATGFVKEHQLTQTSVLANVDLLISFKNPELPSIYIADRWTYLGERFIKVKKSDIDAIDTAMGKITAL
jgi:thiol-disulfide isomerase/thioredoxin